MFFLVLLACILISFGIVACLSWCVMIILAVACMDGSSDCPFD